MDRLETDLPISSNSLLEIRNYWMALKQGRPMPLKEELNPASIARHLPNVALVDVFHNPLRFKYRLLGTRITELAGRNATGKWLDKELYGENTENMLWMFRNCAASKQPVAVREQIQFVDKSWINVDVAAFPMGNADGEITVILSAVDLSLMEAELPSPGTSFVLNWQASETTYQNSPDTNRPSSISDTG